MTFLFSCKKENNISTIDILEISKDIFASEKIISSNLFFKSIQAIKLETKAEALIKHIRYIYIYNSLLFILHDQQISVFDLKGNFLRKIGNRGNGPDEFNYLPEGFAFHKNYIYINNQQLKKTLIYSIEGDYIKSFKTNHIFSQFKIFDNKLLIGYTPNRLGNEPNKLYIYNLDGILIDSIKNKTIYNDFNASYSFPFECPIFSSNNNSIGFKEILTDTLYNINSDFSLNPVLVFNIGDLKLKADDIYKQKDINKALKHGKKILEVLFDNENYMIIKDWDTRFTVLIWDKNKQSIDNIRFLYNEDFAKQFNKEESYILINPKDKASKYMIKDGTLCFVPRFVSEDNKYLISYETSATNEDDNPIIVLAEIK